MPPSPSISVEAATFLGCSKEIVVLGDFARGIVVLGILNVVIYRFIFFRATSAHLCQVREQMQGELPLETEIQQEMIRKHILIL